MCTYYHHSSHEASWSIYLGPVMTSIIQDVLKFNFTLFHWTLLYRFDPWNFLSKGLRCDLIAWYHFRPNHDYFGCVSLSITLILCLSFHFFLQCSKWKNASSQFPDGTGKPVQRRRPGEVQMWVWRSLLHCKQGAWAQTALITSIP